MRQCVPDLLAAALCWPSYVLADQVSTLQKLTTGHWDQVRLKEKDPDQASP